MAVHPLEWNALLLAVGHPAGVEAGVAVVDGEFKSHVNKQPRLGKLSCSELTGVLSNAAINLVVEIELFCAVKTQWQASL